jgi:hypothetical protein
MGLFVSQGTVELSGAQGKMNYISTVFPGRASGLNMENILRLNNVDQPMSNRLSDDMRLASGELQILGGSVGVSENENLV